MTWCNMIGPHFIFVLQRRYTDVLGNFQVKKDIVEMPDVIFVFQKKGGEKAEL